MFWLLPQSNVLGGEHVLKASGFCVSVAKAKVLKMMIRKQRHDYAADVSMWPRQSDGKWQKLGSATFPEVGKVPQGVCMGGMVQGVGWLLQVGGVPAWQGVR